MASVTHLTNQSQFIQSNAAFNGTNITGTIASNGISLSVANPGGGGGAAISGGANSQNTGTVNFSNSNGVTFGLSNNGVMTASVQTNYQSQGAYLTTAMASNRGSDFLNVSGGFSGTNISGTLASNGLQLSVAPGGEGADGYNIIGVNGNSVGSAATIQFSNSNNVTFGLNGSTITASASYPAQTAFVFSNSNGVSFGTNGSTITATVATNYQSQGAYLTTARASNDAIGLNSALTANGVSMTANSSGLSLNFPAFLTTAQPVGAYLTTAMASNRGSDFMGTNTALTAGALSWTANSSGLSINAGGLAGTTTGFGGNLISGSMTHNTAGLNLSLNHPAWLTTAMASNAVTLSNIRVSGGTTSNLLSAITFSNSNGVSFGLNAGTMTASHNGLTTAAQSDHSHGNPTLALTNLSGTTASNSAGLTLSLSAAAPGGGAAVTVSASNGSFTVGNLNFSNANNVTFGTSAGSIITASVAAPGAAAENNWVGLLGANTAGNTTASGSTIGYSGINLTLSGTNNSVINISAPAVSALVGVGGISLSTNGSTISISNTPATASMWYPYNEAVNVMGAQGNATWQFAPVPTPMDNDGGYVTVDRVVFPMLISNATNTTGSATVSVSMGLYTKNDTVLSLAHSASGSFAVTYSGTVNNSTYAGIRLVTIPFSTSIDANRYYVGVAYRSTTGGANCTVSQVLVSQLNSNFSGMMGEASNRSYQWPLGLGVRSASSSGFFSSIAFSQIDGTASLAARPPSWHMRLGTV